MKFEHLIQINDPLNPLIEALTREQLWRGLVLRANSPMMFIPHLDECTILDEACEPGSFQRRLRYGELVIEDRVLLTPLQEVRFDVPAQKDIPPSCLVMTIEAPDEQQLFVRFAYDDGNPPATDGAAAMYEDFKRSAYVEADIDTVRIVRALAAEGRLEGDVLN
jgi:hypothetical protein